MIATRAITHATVMLTAAATISQRRDGESARSGRRRASMPHQMVEPTTTNNTNHFTATSDAQDSSAATSTRPISGGSVQSASGLWCSRDQAMTHGFEPATANSSAPSSG